MTEKPWDHQVSLTDPRALRAYAHPTRMSLVGLLRMEGPFTATRAAELTGESVASCSYHLRILAKYGLVEEADPGGPGREKPWRATAAFTEWPNYSPDPAVASAADALNAAVAENQFHRLMRALETRHNLPEQWQRAERHTDVMLYLTPEELTALGERFDAMVEEFADRAYDPALRPEGARRVAYLQVAYVAPDRAADTERPGEEA
ncbi:winged helix-turn-helix domain-containing protein [Actinacidiphila paucisporea]|uniref:Transcriptional regulator, ArsR family n=1 Tax=Actinacidiphila paucisporea TaxID=310782 RepID=A0A1M6X5I8_9ACTN|nr:helix-turn-helix domain-containing protein [Actinacidiphila paucisporea]SHL01055.1 transcriptional regulator, ArsR family [Actinacidiphila paucisporea]